MRFEGDTKLFRLGRTSEEKMPKHSLLPKCVGSGVIKLCWCSQKQIMFSRWKSLKQSAQCLVPNCHHQSQGKTGTFAWTLSVNQVTSPTRCWGHKEWDGKYTQNYDITVPLQCSDTPGILHLFGVSVTLQRCIQKGWFSLRSLPFLRSLCRNERAWGSPQRHFKHLAGG